MIITSRKLFIFLTCLLVPTAALRAERPLSPDADVYSTPENLVAAIYAPYLKDGKQIIPPLFSIEAGPEAPHGFLHQNLWDSVGPYLAFLEENPGKELGVDPLVDGQDFEISDFKIHPAEVSTTPSGRRPGLVVVTFKNFNEPREIWLGVEDIGGPRPWQLTAVRVAKGHEGRKYDLYNILEEFTIVPQDEDAEPEDDFTIRLKRLLEQTFHAENVNIVFANNTHIFLNAQHPDEKGKRIWQFEQKPENITPAEGSQPVADLGESATWGGGEPALLVKFADGSAIRIISYTASAANDMDAALKDPSRGHRWRDETIKLVQELRKVK